MSYDPFFRAVLLEIAYMNADIENILCLSKLSATTTEHDWGVRNF